MLSNPSAAGAALDASQCIRYHAEEGKYDHESDSDLDEFEGAVEFEGTHGDLSTPRYSAPAATNGMPHELDTTTGSPEPLETTSKGGGHGTRRILVPNVAFRT